MASRKGIFLRSERIRKKNSDKHATTPLALGWVVGCSLRWQRQLLLHQRLQVHTAGEAAEGDVRDDE